MKRFRRSYDIGHCGDCGRTRLVTRIVFWLNGYTMLVCSECIKPYRKRILR